MSDSNPCSKRKGGAEKAREKNKKLLIESSAKCPKLTDMFKIKKNEITDKISKTGKSIKLIYIQN